MKRLNIILIIISLIVFINNYVYGSFADYTDDDAEKDTQKLIQEHKENFDNTKSENNYLKSLSVSGGVLSPDFDRQIVEYSVKVTSNINEINIIAETEDEKAKINGNGKIDINDISECRIEVVADSGTVRTYFLKIIKETQDIKDYTNSNTNSSKNEENELNESVLNLNNLSIENVSENMVEEYEEVKENSLHKENKGILYLIMAFLIIVLLAIIYGKKKNQNTKHM